MHREAEGQKRTSDCSSGAKERRVGADEFETEPTGVWLLGSAPGSQIQVYIHPTRVCILHSTCQTSLRFNQSPRTILICILLFLSDSEECEEAYSELLSLYEAKRQQTVPLQTDPAGAWMPGFTAVTLSQFESRNFSLSEPAGDRQQTDSPSAQLRKMGTEELSTSFSATGATEAAQSHTNQR